MRDGTTVCREQTEVEVWAEGMITATLENSFTANSTAVVHCYEATVLNKHIH